MWSCVASNSPRFGTSSVVQSRVGDLEGWLRRGPQPEQPHLRDIVLMQPLSRLRWDEDRPWARANGPPRKCLLHAIGARNN